MNNVRSGMYEGHVFDVYDSFGAFLRPFAKHLGESRILQWWKRIITLATPAGRGSHGHAPPADRSEEIHTVRRGSNHGWLLRAERAVFTLGAFLSASAKTGGGLNFSGGSLIRSDELAGCP
eukprot:821558-Prorocentrum_minimum.AAC.2